MAGLDDYLMMQMAQQQPPQQSPMSFWQSLFNQGQAPQQGKQPMGMVQMGMKMMQPQQEPESPQPFTPQQKPQPQQVPQQAMYPYFGGMPLASQVMRQPMMPPRRRA